jgi:hypothetical protein
MTKEDIAIVIKGIQMKANRLYGAKLFKTVGPDKEMLKGLDAIENSDLPKWKKALYRTHRKFYDHTETILDEEVAKKQDLFIQKEIKKAIKKGLLPEKYDETINPNGTNENNSGEITGSN